MNNNKTKNVLRDVSCTKIKPFIHQYFGNYYSVFHKIMLIIILFIGLCVNDIIILIITLIVLTLESYINISNDDYPLTLLEERNMIRSREKKERKRRKEGKEGKEGKDLKITPSTFVSGVPSLFATLTPSAFGFGSLQNSNNNYFITSQCEIIINIWIFIGLKILIIICHNMFMQNIII